MILLKKRRVLNLRRFLTAFAIAICISCSFATSTNGQSITMTGDYSPTYDGTSNPWNVGADLFVGDFSVGSMTVSGGASLITTKVTLVNAVEGIDGLYPFDFSDAQLANGLPIRS